VIIFQQVLEDLADRHFAVGVVGKLNALSVTGAVGRSLTSHDESGWVVWVDFLGSVAGLLGGYFG
jgi:hypothetical protein